MSTAALLIAIVSLLVAAMSLGWQIASLALRGRRAKVLLIQGVEGRGGVMTAPVNRNGAPSRVDTMRSQGWDGPEILAIEVVNIGRAKLTVTGYSIRAVGTGMSFSLVGDGVKGRVLPFRLEPGEAQTWYAEMQDVRALVRSAAAIGKSATRVNMSVRLGTGQERVTSHSMRVS